VRKPADLYAAVLAAGRHGIAERRHELRIERLQRQMRLFEGQLP
jgi:hypothetical protein